MERLKICSVRYAGKSKLNFQYHSPVLMNIKQDDILLISQLGEGICRTLVKYTYDISETTVFTVYYINKMISMDIDSLINKKLSDYERQNLADLSAMVLNILAKYYHIG